jgi:hypothetical protein
MEAKGSLTELLDKLPKNEIAEISANYSKWYNLLLKLYAKDFDIEDSTVKDFENANEVVRFFQTAIDWWEKKKPIKNTIFTPLDSIKMWTCNGQIAELKRKYSNTGLPPERLSSDSWEEQPEPDD